MSLGKNVSLHLSTDEGASYGERIAHITQMEGGERTAETTDDTTYGDPDYFKRFGYGLLDAGEYTITVNYLPDQTEIQAFEAAQKNRELVYAQLRFPEPILRQISFVAVVTKVGIQFPIEGKITRMISLKITGEPIDSEISGSSAESEGIDEPDTHDETSSDEAFV